MAKFFPLNFKDLHEININPGGTALYARVAGGITGASQSNNDVVDQTPYLDGDGYASSDVTGGQRTIAMAGHRKEGDEAQDYIIGVSGDFGQARKTQYRYRDSLGAGFDAEVTLVSIEDAGGDANAKKDLSFEIHVNGKPVKVPKSIAPDLVVVVTAGSVSGTTSFTATPTGGNTLAYKLTAGSIGDQYLNQYIEGQIGYTSGSDIIATAGQFLTTFEIDTNGRVVASNSYELQPADIAV
jgi:hypothetical protein